MSRQLSEQLAARFGVQAVQVALFGEAAQAPQASRATPSTSAKAA